METSRRLFEKGETKMKENNKYYQGMFGSLKHNILLMLSQIEGNLPYSKLDFSEDLTFIQKRVRQIKSLNKKSIKKVRKR